jgi:hypothetical protein
MTKDSDNSHDTEPAEKSWPERNVNLIIIGLVVACVLTVVAQLAWGSITGHPLYDEKHPAHFEIEHLLGFQAMFGFIAFVVIVFLGRFLRPIIMREETYYDS